MIAILAETPSTGKEIARVLNITGKGEGFLYGNGYTVTWAPGHPVTLALPDDYGTGRLSAAELPLLPDPFRLVVRRKKTEKGYVTDPAAAAQLRVIKQVFNRCESIIAATDAGGEGELNFRYIRSYLHCEKPFRRLWIHSLTDEAILQGFQSLAEGSRYDNLYLAADSRAKWDWLIGINGSQAFCLSSGRTNHSIGRVQTPTLALICARYNEYCRFKPSDYWQLKIFLEKDGVARHFTATENFTDKSQAEKAFGKLLENREATITAVEKTDMKEPPPLLYDLTALQQEANVQYGLSTEETLALAQSLYEKKHLSYPRTGSRYIPQDVLPDIPRLLEIAREIKTFSGYLPPDKLNDRPVNTDRVTDHHALIITPITPIALRENERKIYNMVAGRMLEAFSPECEKESIRVEAACGERLFPSCSTRILTPGWRSVYNRPPDKEDHDGKDGMPAFSTGETVPVPGCNLIGKKTRPRPLHTEATLLAAMENAGHDLPCKEEGEALHGPGLGTPAARAAIIGTLFRQDCIERSGKSLVPAEKGLYICHAVKNLRVADVALTGSWEKALTDMEKDGSSAGTLIRDMEDYTRQVTGEILATNLAGGEPGTFACPKCRKGRVTVHDRVARCNNPDCRLMVFRRFLNRELTRQHVEQLFSGGTTRLIKGFKGRKGNTFDASIGFDKTFNPVFIFPEGAKKNGKGNGKGNRKRPSR